MNIPHPRFAAAGLGIAAIGIAAGLAAGCGHTHDTPVQPGAIATATPAQTATPNAAPQPAGAFQPYVLVNQPPPLAKVAVQRHRALRIVSYHHQICLADRDGRYYSAGRDSRGHLYPVYHDTVTNRSYPLYYDPQRDDYYRTLRTGDGDYYRNYVGTGDNNYYRDADSYGSSDYGGNYSYNNYSSSRTAYDYNPYSPPQACLPQVYEPDGALYSPQPAIHHSHGTQDWWLLAIPVVIGAYLLLNQHHHHSSGPGYAPAPSGYYADYPAPSGRPPGFETGPAPVPGQPNWNPPPGAPASINRHTRDVSTTIIINNNQRVTNIYTVSPPPEAVAVQPRQRPYVPPFAQAAPRPAVFHAQTATLPRVAPRLNPFAPLRQSIAPRPRAAEFTPQTPRTAFAPAPHQAFLARPRIDPATPVRLQAFGANSKPEPARAVGVHRAEVAPRAIPVVSAPASRIVRPHAARATPGAARFAPHFAGGPSASHSMRPAPTRRQDAFQTHTTLPQDARPAQPVRPQPARRVQPAFNPPVPPVQPRVHEPRRSPVSAPEPPQGLHQQTPEVRIDAPHVHPEQFHRQSIGQSPGVQRSPTENQTAPNRDNPLVRRATNDTHNDTRQPGGGHPRNSGTPSH